MYLAVISNPLNETNQSFSDFQNSLKQSVPVRKSEPDSGMTKQQIQNQLIKSQKILSSFVPPERE